MAGNANFDEILSTTLKNYVPKLTDNIFSARPLFYALTNGQTIRRISGGSNIVVPVIYGTNSTAAPYAGSDPISVTPQTGISAAEFNWGQYAATVTITGIEEAKNNGEAQIIDLLEGKIFQTQESIIQNMNTMLWGDGPQIGTLTDWNGIQNLVSNDDVGSGGIPFATNAWWAATETNLAGALTLASMGTLYNDVSVGNDQPTILMTTQAGYEAYEALLTSNVRYTDTDVANAGFQNLMFKGAPVVFDDDCPPGEMYMLNTKYLQLVGHSDVWFKPTPFVRPTNQDAVFSQILCYGQLTVSNRSRQGRLHGITNA